MPRRSGLVSKFMHPLLKSNGKKQPKRVCFLYYQHFNALLYREARTLQQQGFEVDIISLRNTRNEKVMRTFRGINLYGIQFRPDAEKHFVQYIARLVMFYLKSAVLLSCLAFKKDYSLIHVTAPPDIMVFAAIIPKLFGARIILDIHDIGPELFMRKMNVGEDIPVIRLLKFLEWVSAKFSDHVITVTDFWKDKLVERSVDASKITMLLNVPDNELFKPIRPTAVRSSFNLFYHGSIEEHFGLDTLLKAMPRIKEHIPNVLLHLYCGKKGRVYEQCAHMTKELNLERFVIFHGGVPFYELPHTLSSADIGVVPTKDSVFSNEAVSMKALEYISMGIPIVISRTRAHDFYYNNSMVKFFEPRNSEGLADAVIALYENREERERLARNATAFLKKHGWNKSKEVYAKIVNNLVEKR